MEEVTVVAAVETLIDFAPKPVEVGKEYNVFYNDHRVIQR